MPNLTSEQHSSLASVWQGLIRAAIKKRAKFRTDYEEAKKFAYDKHDFMFDDLAQEAPFKATVNKVWEMINIFTPMLAFRNPHRNARVRYERRDDPRTPFVEVLGDLLNYAVSELHLTREMRQIVDDSQIGLGCAWLEKDEKTGLYGHFHDDPMSLLIDPDAERIEDAWWIARRRDMPRWEAADLLGAELDDDGLPRGGHPTITDMAGYEDREQQDHERPKEAGGFTSEIITIYEIWSKFGVGWRAKGIDQDTYTKNVVKSDDDGYGDYVHFYVALRGNKLYRVGEWPIPLWMDNEWPVEMLYFHKDSKEPYPVPPVVPALGIQKAINWMMMFMWQHLKTTSRTFIAGSATLDETTREKILSGLDLEFIPVESAEFGEVQDVKKLIAFLEHPQMNKDLWQYFELAVRMFNDSTGLLPALYAQSGRAEPRTAEASRNRETRADLRPDAMRNVVEEMHAKMARKEAIAMIAPGGYSAEYVGELLGPEAEKIWDERVGSGYREGDINRIMRETDYTIEVGSAAKPNMETERMNALQMFDRIVQLSLNMGDIEATNKLLYNMQKTHGIAEPDMVFINPPPPPEEQQEPREADTAEAEEAQAAEKVRGESAKADKAEADALLARMKAAAEDVQNVVGEGEPGDVMEIRGGQPVRA